MTVAFGDATSVLCSVSRYLGATGTRTVSDFQSKTILSTSRIRGTDVSSEYLWQTSVRAELRRWSNLIMVSPTALHSTWKALWSLRVLTSALMVATYKSTATASSRR